MLPCRNSEMARVPLEFRVEPASAGDESVAKREVDDATATSRVLRVARKQLGVSVCPRPLHATVSRVSNTFGLRLNLCADRSPRVTSLKIAVRASTGLLQITLAARAIHRWERRRRRRKRRLNRRSDAIDGRAASAVCPQNQTSRPPISR